PPDQPRLLATSNERLRLEFDRTVDTPTAEDESKYSLASGIDGSTVDLATVINGGRSVLLDITDLRAHGTPETVTSGGIGAATCPSCLSAQTSSTFVNGVLDVKSIQNPDPDSLQAPRPVGTFCTDRSLYAGVGVATGPRLTVRAVGVGQFGTLQYLEDANA